MPYLTNISKSVMENRADTQFSVPFGKGTIIGDILPENGKPEVLVLHGSGTSNRGRHGYIREELAKDGIATAAIDYIGHGDTGGESLGSSLHERTDIARRVIDYLRLPEPFGVVGVSMGAYDAVKLTEHFKIDRLVLIVPAAYTRRAYDIPFGEQFTEALRTRNSWRDSDAWEILGRFTGTLLVVAAENDERIPSEVPQQYVDSAKNAKSKQLFVVPGASHRVRETLMVNQKLFKKCYQLIKTTLTS